MSKSLSKRLLLLPLVMSLALLSGCETASSSQPPSACPEVVEYSPEWQGGMAEELERLPESFRHLPQAVIDYGSLRDQVGACK